MTSKLETVAKIAAPVIALGLLVEACADKEAQATPVLQAKPTITAVFAPTEVATHAPEATPTPETINLPGVDISEKFLLNIHSRLADKSAFKMKVDAEERPVNESLPDFVSYASKAWGQEIKIDDLSKDPVKVIKKMIADGANGGVDNVTYHHYLTEGEASGEMRFYRVGLNRFPGGEKEIKLKGSYPAEMVLRQGTHITIVGLMPDGKALVSFDEGFKRGGADMVPRTEPRLYFANMPYEAKDAKPGETSVESLFAENNLMFKKGEISFQKVVGGKTYKWRPNRIDEKMAKALKEEAGILWVDKTKDGKFITNPVVSEPPANLVGDKYEVKQDENGDVIAVGANGKKLAVAKWDSVKEEWIWGPIVPPTPTAEPKPTATKVPEMKPSQVRTLLNGSPENYDILNPNNISNLTSVVTQEQIKKLALDQPDKFIFAFGTKGQYKIGDYTEKGEAKGIIVYGTDITAFASFDGVAEVEAGWVNLKSTRKESDGSYYVTRFVFKDPILKTNLKTGTQVKAGEILFKFSGSSPFQKGGEENGIIFGLERDKDYVPPLEMPNGGQKFRDIVNLGASPLNKDLWVQQGGKIATIN